MNTTEREQMIDALTSALQWLHEHGNRYGQPRVVLTESGQIERAVSQDQHGTNIVEPIWEIDDLLGNDWNAHVDGSDEAAVETALRDGAAWYVDELGRDALDDARDAMSMVQEA